ncbi:hypothetical protein RM555_06655 [Micromonospora sp. DSM 115977]|uniref:Ferritin-like domain-containing protein n=1 Tax=Micromonospora reichwaldensis TaxID=3075516 RepID=A0ABU2WSS9_9ACTN|nr:hypothetical protein [Micromonospora sp. DSM 115977]MDT0528669.1 hypothetical protein [Micromonospora sp. DSM 115977]
MLRAGALLALGGAAAPLTGCGLLNRDDDPAPGPDPLTPLLDESLRLAAGHRDAAAAHPALAGLLTPIAEAHRAHAAELARLIGVPLPSASATASPAAPGDPAAARAALREDERAAREAATRACAAAPAERAALLASIAAARATHVEALR